MIDFIAKKNPNDASFICENLISLFTSEKRVFSYLYKSLKIKIKKKESKNHLSGNSHANRSWFTISVPRVLAFLV